MSTSTFIVIVTLVVCTIWILVTSYNFIKAIKREILDELFEDGKITFEEYQKYMKNN